MQLRSVTGTGIFDQTISIVPEAPVVVFTGANESGKTSRVNLPGLAIGPVKGGAFPLVGRQPSRFDAVAIYDDDTKVKREVDRRGTHKLYMGKEGGKLGDVQERITAHLGEAYTWSMAALMAMSPEKRLRWLEKQVLDSAEVDLAAQLAPHAAKILKVLEDAPAEIPFPDEPAHPWSAPMATEGASTRYQWVIPEKVSQEVLNALLRGLRVADKDAHSDALRLKRVVDHDELEAADEQLPAGTVDAWRSKATELRAQVEELERKKGEISGAQQARETLETQIKRCEAAIEAAEHVEPGQIKRAGEARIKAAGEVVQAAEAAVGEAQRAAQTAEAAIQGHEEAKDLAQGALITAQAELQLAETNRDRIATWDGTCPIGLACDSKMPEGNLAVLDMKAHRAGETVEAAEQAARGALLKYRAARRQASEAQKRAGEAGDELRRAEASSAETTRAAQRELSAAAQQFKAAEAATGELGQLQERLSALPTDYATEAIEEQLEALRSEVKQAEQNADKLSDSMHLLQSREEHRLQLEEAKDRRGDARDLIAELGPKGLLGRVLRDAFSPLVDVVNRYLEPITGSKLWVETEGGFTWGYERNWTRVPIETASRSHQAIAMALLAVAVRSRLGGWRFITVDDLENLEASRRSAFVAQLVKACADGVLDGAWVASVEDGWTPPEGAHHMRIGG